MALDGAGEMAASMVAAGEFATSFLSFQSGLATVQFAHDMTCAAVYSPLNAATM